MLLFRTMDYRRANKFKANKSYCPFVQTVTKQMDLVLLKTGYQSYNQYDSKNGWTDSDYFIVVPFKNMGIQIF